MKKTLAVLAISASFAIALPAPAADYQVGATDSIESVLAAQRNKRVTLKLRSGQEITGIVRVVTNRLVQVAQVTGREFFDAVVPLEAVEAVLVRTKD